MKLYYATGACSLSPHIVIREAGLDVMLEKVDLRTKKTETGADYNAVNAKSYVPALELDDGSVLTEGPAIVQYLADQSPDKKLAPPAASMQRYRLQEWLNFITAELHKSYSPLFNPATPEAQRSAVVEKLGKRFDYLAQQLSGKQYLLGEFSVADAYLFTVLRWNAGVKLDLAKWPVLTEYLARVAARPAVAQALQEEGLDPKK